MSKTWRKARLSNKDETFKKPLYSPKRQKQAVQRQIIEEGDLNGSFELSQEERNDSVGHL